TRERAKQTRAVARSDDRTTRHVPDALARERVLPEHERDGQRVADPQVLGSPTLTFAHRGPHRRLQHVTPRRASGGVVPAAGRVHQAAECARRRRAPSRHSGKSTLRTGVSSAPIHSTTSPAYPSLKFSTPASGSSAPSARP